MASSWEYYQKYKYWKGEESKLGTHKKKLEEIASKFEKKPVSGDPDDFNKKNKNALEEHAECFSGDSSFNSMYSALEALNESSVSSDRDLSAASRAIYAEINSVDRQKTQAKNNKDDYYRRYERAKYAEAQAQG